MKSQRVVTFALGSLFCYGSVNWLMATHALALQPRIISTGQMWQGLLTAVILYAVGLIIWRSHRLAGFYVLGIVLIVYSLGLISALMSSYQSSAILIYKLIVEGLGAAGLIINGYLLVLLTRARLTKN